MFSKEYLIQESMQMFVSRGIKAVRMDDIAREIGVSKRTLYEIFGDKEELLYQCMRRYNQIWGERHAQIGRAASNVLEAILLILTDVRDTAETAQRLRSNLIRFYPEVYARLEREHDEQDGRRQMRVCLERGITEGLFDARIPVDLAIALLYYTVSGLMSSPRELVLPDGVTPYKAFEYVMINFFRGISTAQGLRLIDEYLERQPSGGTTDNEPLRDVL